MVAVNGLWIFLGYKIICLFIVCSVFLDILKKNHSCDFPACVKMQGTGFS